MAHCLAPVGIILLDLKSSEKAEAALTRLLAIYEDLPGDHFNEIAGATNNLGEAYRYQGQLELAREAYEPSASMARRLKAALRILDSLADPEAHVLEAARMNVARLCSKGHAPACSVDLPQP